MAQNQSAGVVTEYHYTEVNNVPVRFESQTRLLGGTAKQIYGLGKGSSLFGLNSKSLFG
jgi:hypothetical protein